MVTYVDSCLPVYQCLLVFTRTYLSMFTSNNVYLPLFTLVQLFLLVFTYITTVYWCMCSYFYLRLVVFSHV